MKNSRIIFTICIRKSSTSLFFEISSNRITLTLLKQIRLYILLDWFVQLKYVESRVSYFIKPVLYFESTKNLLPVYYMKYHRIESLLLHCIKEIEQFNLSFKTQYFIRLVWSVQLKWIELIIIFIYYYHIYVASFYKILNNNILNKTILLVIKEFHCMVILFKGWTV